MLNKLAIALIATLSISAPAMANGISAGSEFTTTTGSTTTTGKLESSSSYHTQGLQIAGSGASFGQVAYEYSGDDGYFSSSNLNQLAGSGSLSISTFRESGFSRFNGRQESTNDFSSTGVRSFTSF